MCRQIDTGRSPRANTPDSELFTYTEMGKRDAAVDNNAGGRIIQMNSACERRFNEQRDIRPVLTDRNRRTLITSSPGKQNAYN
ncbi:hypothetical protein WA026_007648 [Henosepilachna vigintioctopunctata]|uniref:Uncharacterized protein n=1 Tax=Henosepilachna vigintioctopunctata TaxID=420089 RepID=A0AAW1U561_9CUCU